MEKSITDKKADKIFVALKNTMFNLYGRWMDEREYENITEYQVVIDKKLVDFGVKIERMTKRPFGFTFILDGVTYQIKVGAKSYALIAVAFASPKAEAPKAEAPKAEAPKAEAPKAEAPKAEAPKAEAPISETEKADKLASLAATVAKKAAAPRVESPIHQAFIVAGFVYIKTQTVNGLVAHGYAHADGRAALYTHDGTAETWAVKTAIGEKGGTGAPTEDALKPITAAQIKAAKTAANKRAASIERGKKLLELDTQRAEKHEEIMVAAKTVPPAIAGMPANVVRAVEILSGLTAKQFDLDMLRGDKHYGHRLALLKRLFNREKVLVAETGINNLTEAFFSAVGAGEGCKAVKAECFATRCSEIARASREAQAAAAKAEKLMLKQNRAMTYAERVVPGTILPIPKPLSKNQQRIHDVAELAVLKLQLSVSPDQPAVPHPDADLELVPADVRLLRNPGNGIVMLQLEKANSQGAIVVYNNGVKVAAGVVAPETLKSLRPVSSEVSLVDVAKQLLNPTAPSVPVTPVAACHLTAVIKYCKETTMTAPATATVLPVVTSKKFEAPKATKRPAAKEIGEPVAKPVVKATKSEKPVVKATKSEKPVVKTKAESKTGGRTATTLYRLVNESKATWSAFKSQKGILIEALVAAGAVGKKATGITSSDLAAKIGKKLTTNQPVERVVGFYFSQWKKDGVIESAS